MKKKFILVATGLGFVQLALSNPVSAQVTSKVLNDVVVTATRSPKRVAEVGKVVRIITAEQLERSQGRNITDVLNNVAGITFSGINTAYGNASTSLFLRGATAGNTLILIDGIPVNDAQHISNEYDLKSFPIDQIERIEILKGGNSTLYGSDAVAGVINIIMKKPSGDKIKGNALLSGGSYSSFKQAFGVDGTLAKTSFILNYSHTSSDEFSAALDTNNTGDFDKDGFRQHAWNFQAMHSLNSKLSLRANVQHTKNTGESDAGAFTDDRDYTFSREFLFAGLTGTYDLNKGQLKMNVSRNVVWNDFLNNNGNGPVLSKTNNIGRIWQGDLLINKQLASFLELNSGFNYRFSNSDQYSLFSMPGYNPPASILSSDSTKASIASAFASFFVKNASGFHFELGGRYNKHSKYGSNLTYTINPSYTWKGKYKFFVNASSAYKSPTLYQLYSEYGNLDLTPEKSNTYDVGFDFDFFNKRLNVNATAFERYTKDVIYFYTDPKTFASNYKNGRKQDDKGFEIELRTNPFKQLSITTFYSYVKGRLIINENNSSNYLFRRPKEQWGGTLNIQPRRNFSLGLIAKHTGTRPEQDFRTYPETIVNHKAYTLLDAYIQFSPISDFTIFGDFKNVTNEKYVDWIGYTTRGSNFNVGMKYVFK